MPPGCCGGISIFAELEDAISYNDPNQFKNAYFINQINPSMSVKT